MLVSNSSDLWKEGTEKKWAGHDTILKKKKKSLWNSECVRDNTEPSASLEGIALIWQPDILRETPLSMSRPLNVTWTHTNRELLSNSSITLWHIWLCWSHHEGKIIKHNVHAKKWIYRFVIHWHNGSSYLPRALLGFSYIRNSYAVYLCYVKLLPTTTQPTTKKKNKYQKNNCEEKVHVYLVYL